MNDDLRKNQLVKYYWLPCGNVDDSIDWSKVPNDLNFSCIPTYSKGIKEMEIGMLRDIVSMAYDEGKKEMAEEMIEALQVWREEEACSDWCIDNGLAHLREKFLNNNPK